MDLKNAEKVGLEPTTLAGDSLAKSFLTVRLFSLRFRWDSTTLPRLTTECL